MIDGLDGFSCRGLRVLRIAVAFVVHFPLLVMGFKMCLSYWNRSMYIAFVQNDKRRSMLPAESPNGLHDLEETRQHHSMLFNPSRIPRQSSSTGARLGSLGDSGQDVRWTGPPQRHESSRFPL